MNLSSTDIALIIGMGVTLIGIVKLWSDLAVAKRQVVTTDKQADADSRTRQNEAQRIVNKSAEQTLDLLGERVDELEANAAERKASDEGFKKEIANLQQALDATNTTLNEARSEIKSLREQNATLGEQLTAQGGHIREQSAQLQAQNGLIASQSSQLADQITQIRRLLDQRANFSVLSGAQPPLTENITAIKTGVDQIGQDVTIIRDNQEKSKE